MRLLRDFGDERTAAQLRDALRDQGIESELKSTASGGVALWVIDEAHMKRATELAASWLDGAGAGAGAGAGTGAFTEAASRGRAERELKERIEQRRKKQVEAAAQRIRDAARPRPTPLTWGLIALCVGVGALTELGDQRAMLASLTIADPRLPVTVTEVSIFAVRFSWLSLPWNEPWRLITPVLVHFGLLHIFFNMLMLKDLGRMIESVHGARYLAAFVLVSGAISNVAQYEITQNPLFAGMSGVVYGLLGLLWVRGRLDPRAAYRLSPATVQFMLIWLVLGFIGKFGIANWCHLGGLLVGVVWAWLATLAARRRH